MRSFPYKGFGRIIVDKPEDVQKVKDILKAMDEFEFGYLPEDLIAVRGEPDHNVYVGKFEPDLDKLEALCKAKGIEIETHEESWMDNMGVPQDVYNPFDDPFYFPDQDEEED